MEFGNSIKAAWHIWFSHLRRVAARTQKIEQTTLNDISRPFRPGCESALPAAKMFYRLPTLRGRSPSPLGCPESAPAVFGIAQIPGFGPRKYHDSFPESGALSMAGFDWRGLERKQVVAQRK